MSIVEENPFSALEKGESPMRGRALLNAVSTLLALTPRGNRRELLRLESLAAAMLPSASGEELLRFAQAACLREDLDPALIRRLLRSENDEVLALVVLKSPLVEDKDLIRLADLGATRVAVAMAHRSKIPAEAISLLVERDETSVQDALLANPNIILSAADQARLLRRSTNPASAATLSNRSDGDVRVLARGFLTMPPEVRRLVLEKAAATAPTMPEMSQILASPGKDIALHINRLAENEDGAGIRAAFAEALGLPQARIDQLVNDGDGIGLVTVARALDLPEPLVARLLIRSLIAVARGPRETLALIDLYRKTARHAARFVINALQRVETASAGDTHARMTTHPRRPVEQSAAGIPHEGGTNQHRDENAA